MTSIPKLSLRTPADVLAAVPYLFGFHPTDSIVLLGMHGRRLVFQARADLLPADETAGLVDHFTGMLCRQGFDNALIIGYGPAQRVTPAVLALRDAVHRCGLSTPEVLRATDGRYWSYTCTNPDCCSAEGTPYDITSSIVAAQATLAGLVALPTRADLERRLAPLSGAQRISMRAAAQRADQRMAELIDRVLGEPAPDGTVGLDGGNAQDRRSVESAGLRAVRRAVRAAGCTAVDAGLDRHRRGETLSDDEVAWLSTLLVHIPVRDYAWERIGGALHRHISMWTDVMRRAEPDLVAAPAALLAFAAWRSGEGAVASIALMQALRSDPDYRMRCCCTRP